MCDATLDDGDHGNGAALGLQPALTLIGRVLVAMVAPRLDALMVEQRLTLKC